MYDDEVKTRETLAESSARSERKCNDLQGEIEDLRASLEQVRERDKRTTKIVTVCDRLNERAKRPKATATISPTR